MKETESSILKETKCTMVIDPLLLNARGPRVVEIYTDRDGKGSTATDSRSKHELPLAYHILH